MRATSFLFIALLMTLFTGCSSGDQQPVKEKGRVVATADFIRHFGPAPKVDKGTAYAFVVYFPSAKEAGKVIPFPFFSFDEPSLKKVALLKLIGGLGDLKGYQGEVSQPFPSGVRVLGIVQSKGEAVANFGKEMGDGKSGALAQPGALDALQLTLKQFPGVSRVVLQVEGKEVAHGRTADESAIAKPAGPRLLSVTAMKDKGAADIDEIDLFFDRPLQIKELKITGTDGKPYQGDIYQSVFDMAAVIKPKDPGKFAPGQQVKVRWSVTDNLGRNASGDGEFTVELKEH